jgi:acetoacetyl-CoA synthetase
MKKPLWEPSKERVESSNMKNYMEYVNKRYEKNFSKYLELYEWSVKEIENFWASVWDYVGIIHSESYKEVVDDPYKMPGAKWFSGAKINFAENLLRYRDDRTAFIFIGETKDRREISYKELYKYVAKIANALREMGVKAGDRVVAYMPNMIETVSAMLAATSIGAIWSSCAADMGPEAVYDRFGQVEPKVLFTVDGYYYKGKKFDTLKNAFKIASKMPSLEKVVVTSYAGSDLDIKNFPKAVKIDEFIKDKDEEMTFEQLPFDTPVYIMFSSGTTGKPKCMVQSAGGVLINHLKELIIHSDLKREDKIFYITTCSWMMWNWLMSSLGAGATIILYDGNPLYPTPYAMWEMAEREKISIFGLSASYVNYLIKEGVSPKKLDLSSLKEISQTGSPLSADGFRYIYEEIKEDVHFNSIAGGTDINGCFAIGSPIQPVYAGELQGPGLGMKVCAYDDNGNPIWDKEGELVCEAAAPSMPLYFWNDKDNKKYLESYFDYYKHKRVWRHGDYVIFYSDTRGITFLGRSDSVLKPSGVRIGTAEIYNQVDKVEEVADSLAIGQSWEGDQRIILFVKMKEGYKLNDEIKEKIKRILRENASPRHVPAKIIEVPDIPYTRNMKKVESAVTNIIHGRPVTNLEALINPECLEYFKDLPELKN